VSESASEKDIEKVNLVDFAVNTKNTIYIVNILSIYF